MIITAISKPGPFVRMTSPPEHVPGVNAHFCAERIR